MKIGNKHFCLRNSFASDGRSALGGSLSLNSHTCIHSHIFLEKCQQGMTTYPTTCLNCPFLCLCYQIHEQ